MNTKKIFAINASLILLLLAACNLPTTPALKRAPSTQPVTGLQYQFVTNKLLVPTTQAQTQDFSLDLDGDPQQRPDNLFGNLLTLLTTAVPNLELQATVDQAVNTGQIVSLHSIRADDPLNDPSVSWAIAQGQKTPVSPGFDGSDQLTLDPAASTNTPLVGTLTNGHFTGGPGSAHIQIFLLGQSIEVNLIGVRLDTDFSPLGCVNGKLGGGITADEFHNKLLPAIVAGLNQIIQADIEANKLLQVLDSNQDGMITVQELEKNPLLMMAISPDLDLLDASGTFNPGQDGVKDSYSMGLGFTCVPAIFTAPEN